MNYYNKKCLGCGQFFSNDKKSPSYVISPNKDTKFCKRCFQLKHYGTLNNDFVENETISKTLENIDFSLGSIILVVDLFDLKKSLLEKFKFNKNLLIAINKISFINKLNNNKEKIKNIELFIRNLGWEQEIIYYDAVNKLNVANIDYWIEKQCLKNKKVFVVGNTNVGKSSLINSLLNYNDKESYLSVSSIKNTTINLSKIVLDKNKVLIDTPGFANDENFLSIIDGQKKITFKKMSMINFQLKSNHQIFFIENIAQIIPNNFDSNLSSSIQFYVPDNLLIHRTNQKNIDKLISSNFFNIKFDGELKTTTFDNLLKNNKYLLMLNGFGFCTFKNLSSIKIVFPIGIEPTLIEKSFI